jgi:hypothetical protein
MEIVSSNFGRLEQYSSSRNHSQRFGEEGLRVSDLSC